MSAINQGRITRLPMLAALVVAVLILSGALPAQAAGTEVNTGYFGRVAIQGYDPVGYFTEGKALKGNESFAYDWLGAQWHFTTDAHRQAFASSPLKYAPQYGGHCAVGVAFGEITKEIDPTAWIIVNGKLYLNYMRKANEAIATDEDGSLRKKADENWKKLRVEAAAR